MARIQIQIQICKFKNLKLDAGDENERKRGMVGSGQQYSGQVL